MSILECFQHGKHLIAIVLSAAGEIEIQSHPSPLPHRTRASAPVLQ